MINSNVARENLMRKIVESPNINKNFLNYELLEHCFKYIFLKLIGDKLQFCLF